MVLFLSEWAIICVTLVQIDKLNFAKYVTKRKIHNLVGKFNKANMFFFSLFSPQFNSINIYIFFPF